LKKIQLIGFDMDHTLIRYDSRAFEKTAHDEVLKKLHAKGYPKEVLTLPFEYELAIRGLVIDKKRGNLLKVSRHGGIRGSLHGTRPLDYGKQKEMYRSTYIDLRDSSYSSIDTAFSISTANLFAQLVDLKNSRPDLGLPDFEALSGDLMAAVDEAHRDDTLKSIVRANLKKYIIFDEGVVEGLERYRKHEKRLFLLTNSDFNYTKLLLDHAINPYLKHHRDWTEIFEFVICSAMKPKFFYEVASFKKIDPVTGEAKLHEGKITPGVYSGGCANAFTASLNVDGDDILYIGDHIYGDILRLKKDCNWRTALVVEELADEIPKYEVVRGLQEEIDALMAEKEPFEASQVELVSRKIENGVLYSEKEMDDLVKRISAIDKKIAELIKKYSAVFNERWGEVMRAGNEESHFAHQVDRFACIYMAKIKDLLELSPRTYFRAPRRPLAHELALQMVSTISPER
jgi:HAD superfamily 5'-nucleotidase-like hydrolase